ncbi:hypothetical protein H6G35_35755 [Aulosira sp. FACHB-113]|uniref:hypothetical protein n=1 Tax=Tolypothrix tenuis TaxID=457083 RepID=UPI00168493C7|nr:hypothetical protein [Aulosira sp. FACHB-113]
MRWVPQSLHPTYGRLRSHYDSLGRPNGGTILIDDDANGVGWFIDPTPNDNSEFSQTLTDTAYRATGDCDRTFPIRQHSQSSSVTTLPSGKMVLSQRHILQSVSWMQAPLRLA